MVTPRQWTLADLRSAARLRCEMSDTDFVSNDELDDYINEGVSELYDILVTNYGDYFMATDSISLVSGTENYTINDDFYKILAVFYLDTSGNRHTLQRFTLDELTEWQNSQILPITSGEHYKYRLVGRDIYLTPEPNASGSLEVWYVPSCPWLSADDSTLDYTFVNGWEEFIIQHACATMMIKEESDPSAYLARKQQLGARIVAAASNRDGWKPHRVIDAYGRRDLRRIR